MKNNPKTVKRELKRKALTQKQVADLIGIRLTAVSNTINGHSKSRRVAMVISELTNIPMSDIEWMWL